jgi:biopolymer transport protein ExbD
MRLRRPKPGRDSEASLIPLINIVFLLLIFFMLAGRLAPSDPAEIAPVRSSSPERAVATPLVVVIDRQGELWKDGARIDDQALVEQVAGRPPEDDRRLHIKADAGVSAVRLMDLLARLRDAGAEQIELLTLARSP